MQVDIIYTLAAVYNFININSLDNLNGNLKIKDKVINKKDIRLIKIYYLYILSTIIYSTLNALS